MTNCLPLVACGWMDGMMDGEWGEMRDETPGDWVDQYAQDRMRTFAVPQNFGVQVSWMNLIHIKDKQRVARIQRGFYDYIRLHDSWTGQNNYVIPNDILDFGLNDERIEYVPYWRDPFVQADKDTLVSLWRLGDRAILEVFNYDGGKTRDVKVALDLGKLGLAPRAGTTLAAVNLAKPADEPACTLDGQTLAVPAVAPHTGRFIGLRLTDDKAVAKLQEALTGLGKLADPQDPAAADCPPAVLDFGMADAKAKSFPPGKPPHVTCEDMDVAVSMVRLLPDRLLLMVSRAAADRSPKDVTLSIDLDKLNLVPKLPWQEFVGVRTFAPAKAPAATLDFHGRKLVLPKMTGFSPRLVAVRMY